MRPCHIVALLSLLDIHYVFAFLSLIASDASQPNPSDHQCLPALVIVPEDACAASCLPACGSFGDYKR
eukprot:2832551-Amphidinium_carterae.1